MSRSERIISAVTGAFRAPWLFPTFVPCFPGNTRFPSETVKVHPLLHRKHQILQSHPASWHSIKHLTFKDGGVYLILKRNKTWCVYSTLLSLDYFADKSIPIEMKNTFY